MMISAISMRHYFRINYRLRNRDQSSLLSTQQSFTHFALLPIAAQPEFKVKIPIMINMIIERMMPPGGNYGY